jgi:hypothetical protein
MSPTPVPTRITIDFREAAMPSRTWILGVDDGTHDRLELIAHEGRDGVVAGLVPRRRAIVPRHVECTCLDFCELDHANE